MHTASSVLSLFLILLSHSGWANGLCNLKNGAVAECHELEDVKYIDTYDLESLRATVTERILQPDYFSNLTSLRHLDLSGGSLEQIKPGSLRKLVNLRSLNLAENRIGYLDLGSMNGLNHLHSLNLRRNNLRQLPPTLAHLKVLRHLDIQGNPLECNCATLRVRDLILKRGVKLSKKILCAGPSGMKGTSLFKPDATTICNFEEQDAEMQRDQSYEGLEEEYGSGDVPEKLGEEEECKDCIEIETPFPEAPEISITPTTKPAQPDVDEAEAPPEVTTAVEGVVSSTPVVDSIERTLDKDQEIFFDSDEKKDQTSAIVAAERKKVYKDALFYPVEGSGEGDEGSGEGSGAGILFGEWKKVGEVEETSEKEEESTSLGDRIISSLFNIFWSTTETPELKKDLDLEGEQFIDASPTEKVDEKPVVSKTINSNEAAPGTTEMATEGTAVASTNGVELIDSDLHDYSKMGNVRVGEESLNDELAEVSPAKQSKKGMGSYVVLAALLAILATLIGFAAYKGNFCKKKRKRGDVENGTELKDMQKALLDAENVTQPKISSNGNVESVPLVEDATDHDERKTPQDCQDQSATNTPISQNGTADRVEPVKPPRRSVSSQDDLRDSETTGRDASSVKDNSLSARTSPVEPPVNNGPMAQLSEVNGPPLSPGAQRVKITLQENPDSVPRTPILITRTMAGENLVKTP